MSLAGQYLALQLLIVLAVLVGVVAISLAQSAQAFERVEGRRALSAAESVAAMPVVRSLLPGAEPKLGAALPAVAESARTVSGSSFVTLAKPDLTILTSPDPSRLGRSLELGDSDVRSGRSWTGTVSMDGIVSMVAHVPVLDDAGSMVGIVAVGREYPSLWERLGDAAPNLLAYVSVSLALGTVGSLLLSRRVKRQTLGMEPDEIAGLVEHREALVHGVKEGVIALDPQERITVANDSAREFLHLPEDCVGRKLEDLGVSGQLREELTTEQPDPDRLVLVGERMVVLNRKPMVSRGRIIGSVTTLRDRTELSSLEKELGATRTTTDTLRAQTHEFANQLHTISGLIQLGEYDEVVNFVDGVSHSRNRLQDDVTTRINDPALAALLIAKTSLAAERAVSLQLDDESSLGRVDEQLSRDLTTVVGNLVDNAMDAVSGVPNAAVRVGVADEADRVLVTVRDSGPGVPNDRFEDIFRQGFSTKAVNGDGGRGFGLALTRLVCLRRGGEVGVRNEDGAVFTASLRKRSPA
ncbi:sensor histidine kinase [Arthrobacter sp. ISL-30]|uniref:sensor histidine kinase n=1 Tax=Arthrobacter sp. ISL-30 TaxID=2819109 RepID=UPI001BE6BB19|nr:sensor histidine kinase [Arthrobacter sp. ISL-30]MBT2511988.1 sensor histidine kinase [Arthrobacter sp. ISL-30]